MKSTLRSFPHRRCTKWNCKILCVNLDCIRVNDVLSHHISNAFSEPKSVFASLFFIHWNDALNTFVDDKCKQVAREMQSTVKLKKKKRKKSRKASNASLKSVDGWIRTKWWTSIWLLIKLFSVSVLLLLLLFNVLEFFFPFSSFPKSNFEFYGFVE